MGRLTTLLVALGISAFALPPARADTTPGRSSVLFDVPFALQLAEEGHHHRLSIKDVEKAARTPGLESPSSDHDHYNWLGYSHSCLSTMSADAYPDGRLEVQINTPYEVDVHLDEFGILTCVPLGCAPVGSRAPCR